MALQVAVVEAVLEELGEQQLVLGESDHAVADVSGRKHVEFFAETAGGATIVGDGDDGGEVADTAGKVGGLRFRRGGSGLRMDASAVRRDAMGAATYRLRPRNRVERPCLRRWRRHARTVCRFELRRTLLLPV